VSETEHGVRLSHAEVGVFSCEFRELLKLKKTTVSGLLNRLVHAVTDADHYRRNLAGIWPFVDEFVDDSGASITPNRKAKLAELAELDQTVEVIKANILAHFEPFAWSTESSSSSSSLRDHSMDRGSMVFPQYEGFSYDDSLVIGKDLPLP